MTYLLETTNGHLQSVKNVQHIHLHKGIAYFRQYDGNVERVPLSNINTMYSYNISHFAFEERK